MRHLPGLVWFATLFSFLALSIGSLSAGDPDQLTLKPTAFRSAGGLIQGDRGRLRVQENRTSADSRSIEIAFVRFRHPESSDEAPIVYLPGGPGQPVIQDIDHFALAYRAYLDIGGGGDMLVVEQRGVGASRPRLDCPGVLLRPNDGPLSSEDMASSHVEYINTCMHHWRSRDVDFAGYNVVEMAADVDELRAALGYEKVKLFGESFGTHHALAMIALFGERIERAALTAVIGPDDMFELPGTVDDQFARLSELSRNDPALAGEKNDLHALMTSAFATLKTPITLSLPPAGGGPSVGGDGRIEVGRYDLALATVTMLRQTSFMRQLPGLYKRIIEGDAGWLGRWSAIIRQGQPSDLASLLIACASGASAERRAAIVEQAAKSPLGDAVDLLSADACTPFDDLGLKQVTPPRAAAGMPVLMVSGELDPRAPPGNAEALLAGLPNASHVVFPGVSHDFGDGRDALLELIYRFLAFGETKPDREPPPFTFLPAN